MELSFYRATSQTVFRADTMKPVDSLNEFVIADGRKIFPRFLEPLRSESSVRIDLLGAFEAGGAQYSLPRFTFQGPNSSDPIRVGIFAAIHGDEPAGALAAARFL